MTHFLTVVLLLCVIGIDAESSLKEKFLYAHNQVRALHKDTAALVWDSSLAAEAQAWAEHLLKAGRLVGSHGAYGENLYWGQSTSVASPARAVHSWYSEFQYYDYSTTRGKQCRAVRHFAQVVWKSSTSVGCGLANIASGGYVKSYIVCRYTPTGNIEGQYGENVKNRKTGAQTPTVYELDIDYDGCPRDDRSTECASYKSFCDDDNYKNQLNTMCDRTCNC